MSTLPSFEGSNAANQPIVDSLESAVETGRLHELNALVISRVRYAGYLLSNSLNPDPNYMAPGFERYRQERANGQK